MLKSFSEKVAPGTAALLVIDVQNDFCHPDGVFGNANFDLSMVDRMVKNLDRLIEGARKAGVRVIFIRGIYDDIYLFPAWHERNVRLNFNTPRCIAGSWGADFFKVSPRPDEVIVEKHRYSGFVDTNLDLILRGQGIKTVIATGIATNICVESTARDAFMRNYYTVLGEDASAAYSQDQHASAITNMKFGFGVVATTDEILDAWKTGANH